MRCNKLELFGFELGVDLDINDIGFHLSQLRYDHLHD